MIGLPITGRILRLCRFLETRREEQPATFGLTLGDFDLLAHDAPPLPRATGQHP